MRKQPIILNTQQEKIKDAAVHWFLHESSQVFEISGLAGTGKSVLIFEILRELGLKENEVAAMSYTGQAAIVMRTKGFPCAKSIHSTLYEVIETVETAGDDEILLKAFGGAKRVKKEFRLRPMVNPSIRLFFIDEA